MMITYGPSAIPHQESVPRVEEFYVPHSDMVGFFAVVHSWNTVSSLLESSEDLALERIAASPRARIATGSKQLLLFLTV